MTPFKLAIESFKIDKLGKKWVARCLFLLVYFLNAIVLFFEPGDSDFSALQAWAEKYSDFSQYAATEVVVYPPISLANMIFIFSIIALVFADFLASNLYMRIYLGGTIGQSTAISILWFFRRLPVLSLFSVLVSGVLFVILVIFQVIIQFTSILPILSLFYAFLVFIPPILLYDRTFSIQTLIQGLKRTKGKRIFLFLSSTVVFVAYMLLETAIVLLLMDYKEAAVLLIALITTVLVLSIGRMTGILYERIYLKVNANESENKSIENE